jgi:hypothetical protein
MAASPRSSRMTAVARLWCATPLGGICATATPSMGVAAPAVQTQGAGRRVRELVHARQLPGVREASC